jgi:hypothetical protein
MHVHVAVDTFMSQRLTKKNLLMYVLQLTNAVNDCRDFLRFSTKGSIVLAAFEVVGVIPTKTSRTKLKT